MRQSTSEGGQAPSTAPWQTRYRVAFGRVAPFALLGLFPVALWAVGLQYLVTHDLLAEDFHHFFYPQARDILAGRPPATAYPPLTSLLYVPFATLPRDIADVVVTAVMIALAAGVLLALGIRDWRCYGATMLWAPVGGAIQTANLSLVLALGVALLWRWRARPPVAGALVALMVAAKLFLWPLALWLAATRRWRAVVIMVGIGLAASAAAWAVVGFGSLSSFPDAIRGNVAANGSKPYTIGAVLEQLGASDVIGYAVCWVVGAIVLAAGVRFARRGDDAEALALFIGAALVLSPIVWAHYLALLLVPVALARPRFSGLWLVPLPLWLCPQVDATLAQKLLLLVTGAVIVLLCLRGPVRMRLPRRAALPAQPV
jgi:hypothetical protein